MLKETNVANKVDRVKFKVTMTKWLVQKTAQYESHKSTRHLE